MIEDLMKEVWMEIKIIIIEEIEAVVEVDLEEEEVSGVVLEEVVVVLEAEVEDVVGGEEEVE